MQDQLRTLSKQAKDKQKEHKTFFIKLRKKTPKKTRFSYGKTS
jgi:hypothetical protein